MDLGQYLYTQLTSNPVVIGKFSRLSLQIKPASPQVALIPVGKAIDGKLSFSRPLVQATAPGSAVYSFFIPTVTDATPRVQAQGNPFVQALARKEATVKRLTALQPLNRPLVLLVQGAGDWVEKAFRPTFLALARDHELSVFYADDTSWRGTRPAWTRDLQPWEVYLDKASPHDLALYHNVLARVDAVFIATPDVTHAEIARECVRRRVPTIFIEKPFDSHRANVESLGREMGFHHRSKAVLGLDHYMFYVAVLRDLMPDIQRHLGGSVTDVAFYMTETQPIEHERERSLQYGLTLDMLPHMLALLTYFGSVHTVDDIRVDAAGQYRPLISQDQQGQQHTGIGAWYRHETYARIRFTYEDYAGNRIPCLGVVGKGLAQEVKYLEVRGVNGNAVRIDLGKRTGSPSAYPYDSIFFLVHATEPGVEALSVVDPYNTGRTLHILPEPMAKLDRDRYKRLILDLIKGTDEVIANVLLFDEAYEVVKTLDRIWEAIQEAKPYWQDRELGKLVPVQSE
jgi:predicted dehydrogenase